MIAVFLLFLIIINLRVIVKFSTNSWLKENTKNPITERHRPKSDEKFQVNLII